MVMLRSVVEGGFSNLGKFSVSVMVSCVCRMRPGSGATCISPWRCIIV